jgi:hypothetical protein
MAHVLAMGRTLFMASITVVKVPTNSQSQLVSMVCHLVEIGKAFRIDEWISNFVVIGALTIAKSFNLLPIIVQSNVTAEYNMKCQENK